MIQDSSAKSALFRSRDVVMNPHRLGAMHQTRLSFVRSLLRRMANQQWEVSLQRWDMSKQGFGTAIYRLTTPNHCYHLVVFSTEIADEERNDRVIAEKWDTTFALVKGEVNDISLEHLRNNVPLQEAGRNTTQVLVLARANKSVRVFEHIVASLAEGKQPDSEVLASVGYILRTTAVYGNGKFGIADFETLQDNPDFNLSFSAQMCAVYLLRQFSLDWVHFLAQQRGGSQATYLNRQLQRYLGVGNATGLGMAPYLINHPRVVDQWLSEREAALTKVANCIADPDKIKRLSSLLKRAQQHLQQVVTINDQQRDTNLLAGQELETLSTHLSQYSAQAWSLLLDDCSSHCYETQEVLIACLLELYPELVDSHEFNMNADESLSLARGLSVKAMTQTIESAYAWVLNIDFNDPDNEHWFWYSSEDKEEPRLGVRESEAGADRESPLDIARQVSQFYQALQTTNSNQSLAEFLLERPQYRLIARRVWTLSQCPMGEIQMNVLAKDALPMHLLRCKLSMFGATKFDPRSDRWVRVTLFQGAPLADEIHADEWLFPLLPKLATAQQGVALSHNELISLCKKAFLGVRCQSGESDRVANMVAALEMVGLSGVKSFVHALPLLQQQPHVNPQVDHLSNKQLKINMQGSSLLSHLPSLLAYAQEKLVDHDSVTLKIEDCFSRWLVYGELAKLAKKGFYIKASWYSASHFQYINCLFQAHDYYPEIYMDNKPTETVNDLLIQISKKPFDIDTISGEVYLNSEQQAQFEKKSWENGVTIDYSDWQLMREFVKATLVASSAESLQGAGGA